MIQVLANQRHAVADASVGITEHALVRLSCTKQHMQGVWGRAAPPMGSATGKARSQIVNRALKQGERKGPSPRASILPSNDKTFPAAFMIMKLCRSYGVE